jgi:hypothetical protein
VSVIVPPEARFYCYYRSGIIVGERCQYGILVCDMPERKRLIGTRREHAQYVADVARLLRLSAGAQKNGSENRGHSSKV